MFHSAIHISFNYHPNLDFHVVASPSSVPAIAIAIDPERDLETIHRIQRSAILLVNLYGKWNAWHSPLIIVSLASPIKTKITLEF